MEAEEVNLDLFSNNENSSAGEDSFPDSDGFDFMKDIENLMDKVYGSRTEYKPYDIGRNDPCPCGSGKKYKKCCGRIRPEHSADYYIEKIAETENLDQAYELIKEAEENHPLNIGFIVQLILISGKKEKLAETETALLKLWRLLGTEMGENLTAMLLSLLINSEKFEELAEIERELQVTEIKNTDLLLFLSINKIMKAEVEAGLDFLNQALDSSELPDSPKLLMEIMKFFYEKEEYQLLYNIWLDNFEKFEELKEKFGRKKLPIIALLKAVLFDTFALDKEVNLNSRTVVKKYFDKFIKLQQNIEAIAEQSTESEIDSILAENENLIEELAFDSTLYLMFLERLIGAEYYSRALEFIEKAEKDNAEEAEFLMFKARANYYLGNYTKAEKNIEKSLANFEGEVTFDKLTILGDKLLILMAQNNYQQVFDLLEEIKQEEERPLLAAAAKSLAPHSISVTLNLFKEMLELPDNELIDQHKLYLNIFYYLFIKRDEQKLKLKEIGAEFKTILTKMPEEFDNQLARLAELYLKFDESSQEQLLEELAEINKQQADFTEEVQIKFETNLKLKNYDYILNKEYFSEENELLPAGDFAFYRFVALINEQGMEAGLSYLDSLTEDQAYDLYDRIMQEGETFLNEEKVLAEIKEKGIFGTIY